MSQSYGWDLQTPLGQHKECRVRNVAGGLSVQNCIEYSKAIQKSLIMHCGSREENWAYWQGSSTSEKMQQKGKGSSKKLACP